MTSPLVSESISSLLSWPVGNLMNNDAIILEADETLDEAIKRMKERNLRSVLASHLGEVVGMVSKTDILYKVTSEGKNPSKIKPEGNYDISCSSSQSTKYHKGCSHNHE